ncbi:MAG: hypothetical protein HYX47_10040 [Burkholderiales bacterium]|nr:hypothetical protein [Burkholderiales bacterium]
MLTKAQWLRRDCLKKFHDIHRFLASTNSPNVLPGRLGVDWPRRSAWCDQDIHFALTLGQVHDERLGAAAKLHLQIVAVIRVFHTAYLKSALRKLRLKDRTDVS